MAVFIGVPLKKTNEVDLVKPLKNLFSSYCISADEPVQYDNALNELNKLRMSSTWKTLDKTESSLDVMCRYYDYLTSLETKCPSVEFPVPFKWKDAFDKGSLFMGSASLTIASLLYERLCILFNIAAMQSQIAVDHGTDTRNDDSLKQAAKYFQLSSGTFWQVKSMIGDLRHDPTPDLQPDTLSALHSLMLAQAQESFFQKAMADNMKESIIAKVASQCEDHYAEALRHMQKDTTRVIWDKEWMSMIAGKQAGFQALAEYYQSLACKAKKEVGEEVARLKHAVELINLAEVRGGATMTCVKDFASKILYAYDEAKKDNDFIYHARVPDIKALQPVGKAPLAKPTPVPERLSPNSTDLFADLLPMPVQQAIQTYETRKLEIINVEKTKILSQTQLLNSVLASLNLPAALEDTTGDSIPQSLKDKGQLVLERGGCESLTRVIEELPNLLQRNKEILNECTRMLNDEEESDNKMRAQFKTSWSRTPSSKLNEPLKSSIQKYHTVISNAINADEIVRQKFDQNKEKITMLCLPEDELISRIPKGSPVAVCSSAEELKKLMNQVKELLYERTSLKDELDSKTIDMKSKFLTALAQDGCINESSISVSALEELYGSVQRSIQDNLEKQDHLVAEIQRANTEFCKEKDQKKNAADRETVLKDLAAAYDVFVELSGNLEEGTKFYNNLTQILVAFQNKINDFCFARKTEREELCKELQKNIVAEANKQQSPQAPAHHAQNAKPSRPPPPKNTNSYIPPSSVTAPPAPTAGSIPYPPDLGQMGGMPQYPAYPTYPTAYPYPTMPATAYYPYPQAPMGGMPQYPPASGYQGQPQHQQPPVQADQYHQPNYQQYPQQQQQYQHQYYAQQQQQQQPPWHQ